MSFYQFVLIFGSNLPIQCMQHKVVEISKSILITSSLRDFVQVFCVLETFEKQLLGQKTDIENLHIFGLKYT